MPTINQREALLRSVFTKHVILQQQLIIHHELMDNPEFKSYCLGMSETGEAMEQAHVRAVQAEMAGAYSTEGAEIYSALDRISRLQNDLTKRIQIYARKKEKFHASNNPTPAPDPAPTIHAGADSVHAVPEAV